MRARFETGPLKHQITVAGSGFWRELEFNNSVAPGGLSNLYAPRILARPTFPSFTCIRQISNLQINRSVSISDTISMFDDRLLLTLGGRLQGIAAKSYNQTVGPTLGFATSRYDDSALTPAVGLVVKPLDGLSLYGNYIEGLVAGGVAPATASNAGEVFAPVVSRQKEVGVKYDFGTLGVSFAAFDIERPSSFTDAATRRFSVDGMQRNQGLEFNLFGEPIQGVRFVGGVALIDGELLKTANGTFDGRVAPGVPKVNVSLYGEYDMPSWLLRGLTATGRVIYSSPQYFDQANTQKIADWTRLDAGLRYSFLGSWGKPVTLRANVENVLGTNYWASTGGGRLTLGNPRTYVVSAQFDF